MSRRTRFDDWVRSVGEDPDPRFTLANERTYLAWLTTSLGLLGIGLAVGTLIPGKPVVLKGVAVLWILLAVLVLVRAVYRWYVLERAMRLGEALPLSRSIPFVALAVGVLAVASALVIVAS
jgi:putative membrane protein